MKINELIGKQLPESETRVKKKEKPEQAFGDLLSQEIQNSGAVSSAQTQQAQTIAPVQVSPRVATSDPSASQRVASQIENTLDQWAGISDLVATPDSSSKEIQSRIGSLLDSSQSLQKQCEALPENHPLRRIADELNVLSYVESIKWQRGDYLG